MNCPKTQIELGNLFILDCISKFFVMSTEQNNSGGSDGPHIEQRISITIHDDEAVFDAQSGTAKFNVSINSTSNNSNSQNVSFKDQSPAYEYSVESQPDASFGAGDTNDADLGNFFERPLKIFTDDWATTDANYYQSINPWSLYFENPRVVNRVANYNLLRCKLHLKILINGNGFHYGRMIAAYKPLHNLDGFTISRGFVEADLVAASQRPHIYLDPTTSAGGEMTLPFFWIKNALSIPNSEWEDMGELEFHPLQLLKHANGATDSVTISVFAWATDVSLSVPTVAEPDTIAPQSGVIYDPQASDEYDKNNGPISKPATMLAKIAGRLSDLPVIGAYARASEMAASSVANIANLFGYSRPASLVEVESYKPTCMGNLANTNVPDSVQKLTTDFKQEITVDPRTTGLSNVDEMAITSVVCRESYLAQAPWLVSDTTETLLFSAQVTPYLWTEYVNGANTELHMPACCFGALPFEHWRGSMKYRFQIVSSQYHKGRLRIVYDPATTTTPEYNTNYTKIIDIAEEKDFTVEIGWGSEFPYLQEQAIGTEAVPWKVGPTAVTVQSRARINGYISVYVVNELTVPNSTVNNDVAINVFVSAGEDMEFFNPSERQVDTLTWFAPQSGIIYDSQSSDQVSAVADEENTDEPSKPMGEEVVEQMAPTIDPLDGLAGVCFGEKIMSFRQCLKRYNYHSNYGGTLTGLKLMNRVSSIFPFYRGKTVGGIHTTAAPGSDDYNYVKMTMLNYITPAFTGWRGGVRHKMQLVEGCITANRPPENRFMLIKREFVTAVYTLTVSTWNSLDTQSVMAHDMSALMTNQWDGTTANAVSQNGCIEAELPYQAPFRFWPAKKHNYTSDASYMDTFSCQTITNIGADSGAHVMDWVAAGDDYSLFLFTGCPIAYYAPTDLAAV